MAVELPATLRTESGKGAARRIRRADGMPAIIYGGKTAPVSITTSPRLLTRILLGSHRRNTVIDIQVEDGDKTTTHHVMVKDLQVDVLRRSPKHADFVIVDPKKTVHVRIPFRAEGARSPAMISGGVLEIAAPSVGVQVLPSKIPEAIVVDTATLEYGAFRASDVPMPEGCVLADNPHNTILTVKQPRGALAETKEEETAAAS